MSCCTSKSQASRVPSTLDRKKTEYLEGLQTPPVRRTP
jgi:hypothetical protein